MSHLGLMGLALASGMATALNPCGIAVLPAYLSYLGTRFQVDRPIRHAMVATGYMTLVFLLVFTLLGLAVRVVGQTLFQWAPGAALLVGTLLLVVGVLTLVGRKPVLLLPQLGWSPGGYASAMLGYGLSYAVTSISCTLPVFLSIALQATTLGLGPSLLTFLAFTVGMALVILPISLTGVLAAERLRHWLSGYMLRRVEQVAGGIMVLSAGYLLWYWTIGPERLLR